MESDQLYGWNEGIDISQLCRVCANPDDNLIPIFEGEGLEQELKMKIDKHLPIKVSWDDLLPASICYNCATTLTAWHFLSSECVLAEQKLRALVLSPKEEALEEEFAATSPSPGDDEDDPPSDSELPAEYLYSSNQEFESNDQKEELPSDSEDPVYYPYSCDQDIEQEALEENHPSGGEFARDPDFASSVADVPEDSELLLESNDSRKHAIKKVQPYTVTTDQRRIIKKRSMKPKVVLVKCSKQSKLTVEEQITKALNYLNTRGSESGQNLIKKKFQHTHSTVKMQQTHKSLLKSSRIRNASLIKSEIGVSESEGDASDIHYDKSLHYTETTPASIEIQEGNIADVDRTSVCEMTGEPTVQSVENTESEHCPNDFDPTDHMLHVKLESEVVEAFGSAPNLLPGPLSLRNASRGNLLSHSVAQTETELLCTHTNYSTVTLPSQVAVEGEEEISSLSKAPSVVPLTPDKTGAKVKSNYNFIFYVPPASSDVEVAQRNTAKNVNSCGESVLEIEKSDDSISLGNQYPQLLLVPVDSTTEDLPVDVGVRQKSHTSKRTRFKCEVCNELFRCKASLSSHQMAAHNDLKCNQCGTQTNNPDDLDAHLKSHLDKFGCKYCGKMFRALSSLKTHMGCHKGHVLWCSDCMKVFPSQSDLENHQQSAHSEKPHLCETCGKAFKILRNLQGHMRTHLDDSVAREFKCSFCELAFRSKSSLKKHSLVHTGEKTFICETCGKSFYRITSLKLHLQVHSEDRPHNCNICGLAFRWKKNVRQHKLTVHGIQPEPDHNSTRTRDETKVPCKMCGKEVFKWRLTAHRIEYCPARPNAKETRSDKHTRTGSKIYCKPSVCHICGKTLQNPTSLARHMIIHTGNRPFACDLCEKRYCTKSTRDDHRRSHTGEKPYGCDVCGKTFSSRPLLYIHRDIHLDERRYKCTFCEKRFNRRQHLVLHIRTHTGEKPYACNICSRAFAQRNDMNKHRLTHSSERTFVCKCGMSFRQKRDLNKHQSKHHLVFGNITSTNHVNVNVNVNEAQIIYIENPDDPSSLEMT